jgi:ATP-dependent Clp protease adaptor protein ClpS
MLDVHRRGKGVAGIYPYDIADTKAAQVKVLAEAQEFPLLCTLEPER